MTLGCVSWVTPSCQRDIGKTCSEAHPDVVFFLASGTSMVLGFISAFSFPPSYSIKSGFPAPDLRFPFAS